MAEAAMPPPRPPPLSPLLFKPRSPERNPNPRPFFLLPRRRSLPSFRRRHGNRGAPLVAGVTPAAISFPRTPAAPPRPPLHPRRAQDGREAPLLLLLPRRPRGPRASPRLPEHRLLVSDHLDSPPFAVIWPAPECSVADRASPNHVEQEREASRHPLHCRAWEPEEHTSPHAPRLTNAPSAAGNVAAGEFIAAAARCMCAVRQFRQRAVHPAATD